MILSWRAGNADASPDRECAVLTSRRHILGGAHPYDLIMAITSFKPFKLDSNRDIQGRNIFAFSNRAAGIE